MGYRINPKWHVRAYQRFITEDATLQEQEYTISRDLHSWIMDLNYNQTRGGGSEIWLVMTLKAFPDLQFNGGTGFNRRKSGTQLDDNF